MVTAELFEAHSPILRMYMLYDFDSNRDSNCLNGTHFLETKGWLWYDQVYSLGYHACRLVLTCKWELTPPYQ